MYTMFSPYSINSPFFDAVFVAKEKQSAAAATCVDKLKALEERAKNETGKKDLEAFVRIHLNIYYIVMYFTCICLYCLILLCLAVYLVSYIVFNYH